MRKCKCAKYNLQCIHCVAGTGVAWLQQEEPDLYYVVYNDDSHAYIRRRNGEWRFVGK